jgi:hypothetical protein
LIPSAYVDESSPLSKSAAIKCIWMRCAAYALGQRRSEYPSPKEEITDILSWISIPGLASIFDWISRPDAQEEEAVTKLRSPNFEAFGRSVTISRPIITHVLLCL